MKKMKLLTVVLFILGAGGAVFATEVINVDLNGYNDANAYTGTAVVDDGINLWRVYYGDWGKPVGSGRSNNLADYDDPCKPGIYAAQVWIGDPGTDHTYEWGSELMDDGFVNDPCIAGEPTISLFAAPDNPYSDGPAYGGTFDIYVYGSAVGSFTLETPIYGPTTKPVTGGFTGEFVENQNYVIFENILIDDTNAVTLSYSNKINGLQLVSKKQPVAIVGDTLISAPAYDVAYDTNARGGEIHEFGPDVGTAGTTPAVFYLDLGEYMEYDITVDNANEGSYDIQAYIRTPEGGDNNLDIYFDDMFLGTLYLSGTYTNFRLTTNWVTVNLFEGNHTVKWVCTGPEIYFDISSLKFWYAGEVEMNDCNDVYKYHFNYQGDITGDCHVDANDLALIVDDWLNCYSPDPTECP